MAPAQKPPVAILIINWNNFPDTRECLVSLQQLNYANYQIILVDNGSDDGSRELLQENFPDLKLLESDHNLGFAGGNNIGLRTILNNDLPYTLLLNNDTEVIQPDFLDQLVKELEENPAAAAVGPKVIQPDGTPDQVILPFPTLGVMFSTTLGFYRQDLDRKGIVDGLTGCCVLVRNEAVRQVGLLDENYFMYVEETEWFYRMRKVGWKIVYLPVESIIHKGGASSRKLIPGEVYIERRANVIYTLVKHRMRWQAAAAVLLTTSLLAFRILAGFFHARSDGEGRYKLGMIPEMLHSFSEKWSLARKVELDIGRVN